MPLLAPRSLLVACLALLPALVGCVESKASGRRAADQPDRTDPIASDATWAIMLENFTDSSHPQSAAQALARYRLATSLTDFWVDTQATRSTLYYGRYPAADSQSALKDQQTLRSLAAAGRGFTPRSFVISPVAIIPSTANQEHDLRLAAVNPQAIYTLQVAVYDDLFGKGFREAAQQHAARLRDAGEEAYFYHGPHQSLVTIGVFYHGAVKVIQSGPLRGQSEYHPYIRDELQARYPDMQVNGQRQPMDATGQRFAPTVLVRIPR